MSNINQFKTFFVHTTIFIIIVNESFAITRNNDLGTVVAQYDGQFDTVQGATAVMCDAYDGFKEAICNVIFNDISFHQDYQVYLNKAALHERWIRCESHDLIINSSRPSISQRMFPCYGRHYRLQTSTRLDDHYEFIYLSAGPWANSVFMYIRERTMRGDKYYLKEIIGGISMSNLRPLEVTQEDSAADLESLNHLSVNMNRKVIEINYIQIVMKEFFEPRRSICNLARQQKLQLCQRAINNIQIDSGTYRLLNIQFDRESLDCVNKNIEFEFHDPDESRSQEMFPCYGYSNFSDDQTRIQLSDGYRENSFLVFRRNDLVDAESYYFQASVHNVNFQAWVSSSSYT